jgi:ParB-like chromosome segregation protein Spo0J
MLKKGKHKPIVVDQLGYIVNGHHRYDAYKKLGATYVPVIKVNATIEELIDKYM